MYFKELGKLRLVMLLFRNAPDPIDRSELDKVKSVMSLLIKVFLSMYLTEFGIMSSEIWLLANALLWIDISVLGNLTLVIP